jgi:hypothetical protein
VSADGWRVTSSYKVRLDELRRCHPATEPGPGSAGPRPLWLGAMVEVVAQVSGLFVAARDLTVEKGGVIIQAEFIDQPPSPGCAPLLPAKQIGPGQVVRGLVLFKLPPAFVAAPADAVLSYRPTKWGGAPSVEVPLPRCLADCPRSQKLEKQGTPRKAH